MKAAEFLFPTDLQVTASEHPHVLVVGGCSATAFCFRMSKTAPGVTFDNVTFNNVAQLPEETPRPLEQYSFQVVEIPLRTLTGDGLIRFSEYDTAQTRSDILNRALETLGPALDAALGYHRRAGMLTMVLNWATPQTPVVRALDGVGTDADLRTLVAALNAELCRLVAQREGVFICDVDAIQGAMGKRYITDDLVYFYGHSGHWAPEDRDFDVAPWWNAPPDARLEPLPLLEDVYASGLHEYYEALWRNWDHIWRVVNQIDPVKLVVFDLDDTLWRGQIGEHYDNRETQPVSHGWPIGVWEAVQHLRARGILVAIASKNEPSRVREAWGQAVHADWLRMEDFAFQEIGWESKADTVARIIDRAALTPASVLFVDDNPAEREAVRRALPGLRTLGSNPFIIRRVLLWSAETQIARFSAEAEGREASLLARTVRETTRSGLSREAFLADLQRRVHIFEIQDTHDERFGRALELLNRTNQFNTTGQRRTRAEMVSFFGAGGRVWAFTVADRFSDYGLVGVVLARTGMIEQVAMSCRVIGLDVERTVIELVAHRLFGEEAASARVVETPANSIARNLYRSLGYTEAEPGVFARPGPHRTSDVAGLEISIA